MLDRLELGGQSRIRRSEQVYAACVKAFAGFFSISRAPSEPVSRILPVLHRRLPRSDPPAARKVMVKPLIMRPN